MGASTRGFQCGLRAIDVLDAMLLLKSAAMELSAMDGGFGCL
jgi:hypothetical protein